MKIPVRYILRSSASRRLTSGLTLSGIALVVFVFAAVLMMANGIRQTLGGTGSDDNITVVRKAATSEIMSIMDRETASIVSGMSQVARSVEGRPLVSKEAVVIINLPKLGTEGISNVIVRGVEESAFQLRPQVRLIEGRMFRWGAREIVVGSSLVKRFQGTRIGEYVKFAGDLWKVVGVFGAAGSGFESEAWGDGTQIMNAFKRTSFSTLTLKLRYKQDYNEFTTSFEGDNRLQHFAAKTERQFFAEQSELMATFIQILGLFITVIFSAGATIGAMITMYAAVASRTTEIGTLRALGFYRRSILTAFLAESFVLSLSGGILGLAFASLLQFFTVSTLNFGSFAELAFSFALSPGIAGASLGFALLMGLLGGFLPAVRAARLDITRAFRET